MNQKVLPAIMGGENIVNTKRSTVFLKGSVLILILVFAVILIGIFLRQPEDSTSFPRNKITFEGEIVKIITSVEDQVSVYVKQNMQKDGKEEVHVTALIIREDVKIKKQDGKKGDMYDLEVGQTIEATIDNEVYHQAFTEFDEELGVNGYSVAYKCHEIVIK